MGYSPWDYKELDITEQLTHTHTQKLPTWEAPQWSMSAWSSVEVSLKVSSDECRNGGGEH